MPSTFYEILSMLFIYILSITFEKLYISLLPLFYSFKYTNYKNTSENYLFHLYHLCITFLFLAITTIGTLYQK